MPKLIQLSQRPFAFRDQGQTPLYVVETFKTPDEGRYEPCIRLINLEVTQLKNQALKSTSMNAPKCSEQDYINFLVAAQQVFSTVEAARSHPDGEQKPAHDAYTRLLQHLPPDSEALWTEVQPCVKRYQRFVGDRRHDAG